jgi:phage tail tape-measure protein
MVDDTLGTNVPGIWALGDCNGRGASPTRRTTITNRRRQYFDSSTLNNEPRRAGDRITAYNLCQTAARKGGHDEGAWQRRPARADGYQTMTRVDAPWERARLAAS